MIRSFIAATRKRARVDSAIKFLGATRREWTEDRCSGLAAEIAFWVVLSIFPGLLVFGAALGWLDAVVGVDVTTRIETEVVNAIETALGSDSGPISSAATDLFDAPSAGALTFGVLFALFSLSRGFNAVVGALDVAYDIETDRSWFHARLTALTLGFGTVVVGSLALAVLFIGPLFGRGGALGSWFGTTWQVLGPLVAFAGLIAWATTVYHIAPLHLTAWRWDIPGAVVAATFWLGATVGFRLYVDSALSGSNAILGAVGGVLTLLLWVYVWAMGLLLGAEINQLIAERAGIYVMHLERRTVRGSAKEAAERVRGATRLKRRQGEAVPDGPSDSSVT